MILGSHRHTAGDTRLWTIRYGKWLDNTATIVSADVTSSSTTCMVGETSILGRDIQFFMIDGVQGETLIVTIQIADSLDNIKTDTISFTVVAP
jgi:hypothetical protein